MKCDDILELVSSGERDLERRPEFIHHLEECARCRKEAPELLAAVRTIRAAPITALGGHPASDQIVVLAMDPGAAVLDINRYAAEHLSGCPTCTAELQDVRRAEQQRLSRQDARSGLSALIGSLGAALSNLIRAPVPARVALVTGLGVLLLAYPAFLGLRHLPRVKAQVANLELRTRQLETETRDLSTTLAQAKQAMAQLQRWSGPLRLFALTSPVRGHGEAQSISLDPGEPYVLVSVRPILAEPSTEADVYQFAIVNTNDELVWSSELTVEGMRRQMRASGALIFPISSTLLAPGKHELRVAPKRNPREPILQVRFEIVPAK